VALEYVKALKMGLLGAYSPENEFTICPSTVRPQILDRMY
jgi:hypothetical protein